MKVNCESTEIPYQQIWQSSSSTFAFCRKDGPSEYTELFWPVKCRDFLGDVVWSTETGKEVSLYRFKYSPEKSHIYRDNLNLHVRYEDKEEFSQFKKNLGYLREIEASNGFKETKYYTTPQGVLLIADKRWQSSIWAISLYTHIVRVIGCGKKLDDLFDENNTNWKGIEHQYMIRIGREKWDKLVKNISKLTEVSDSSHGYIEEQENMYMIHNCSGFLGLFCKLVLNNMYSRAFYAM